MHRQKMRDRPAPLERLPQRGSVYPSPLQVFRSVHPLSKGGYMYTDNNSRICNRPHTKLKSTTKKTARRGLFSIYTRNFNFHGLNNKKFLRALPCIFFVAAIGLSLSILYSYTKHHSYYLQEDASVQTTRFAAKNEIFDEASDSFEVSVVMADSQISVPTSTTTVGALLDELNIDMTSRESDISADTVLSSASSIHIYEIDYQTNTETEMIPYETEIVEVSTIPYGTTRVVQKGVNGVITKTVKQKIVNGEVSGETITNDSRTEPINEIIYKGVGGYFTGDDGVTYHYSHYIDVQATAYTAPEGAKTASGYVVGDDVIAVDPRVIALGTKVYVASDYYDCGVRYARDTGGAIKGRIIDVFMGSDDEAYAQAVSWGRRSARVYFLVD